MNACHEPTLYNSDPEYNTWPDRFWFECSCGWMGDPRPNVFLASMRWQIHMGDVTNQLVRDAVARDPKHAVDS